MSQRDMDDEADAGIVGSAAIRFRSAVLEQLVEADAPDELRPAVLARVARRLLPVDAVGISLINQDFRVPLAATTPEARSAEQLQFTLGHGPCLSALGHRRFVVADQRELERRWPLYAQELRAASPYQAVVALPGSLGSDIYLMIDLYLETAERLAELGLLAAVVVAEEVARALLEPDGESPWSDPPVADGSATMYEFLTPVAQERLRVWAAVGMVMATIELGEHDVLALMRSYAFANDITLDRLAERITGGELGPGALRP
jgi:hypothetical protein